MTDHKHTCNGTTDAGKSCGAPRVSNTNYCRHHQGQAVPGDNDSVTKVNTKTPTVASLQNDYEYGRMPREVFLQRLEDFYMGRVKTTKIAGDKLVEVGMSQTDMLKAGQLLMQARPEELKTQAADDGDPIRAITDRVIDELGIEA